MSNVKCELLCHSNSGHLEIIYTGFGLLEKQGKIDLSYEFIKKPLPYLDYPAPSILFVKINKAAIICFDMTDFGEVRPDILNNVDFYFKRSYSSEIVSSLDHSAKVIPFGLHYRVHERFPSTRAIRRTFLEDNSKQKLKALLQELGSPFSDIFPRFFRFNIDNCYAKPDFSIDPGIIFMARLWDPATTQEKYQPEREIINQMRAECVRKLRKEFGKKFMGGLSHNDFTRKNYPDCLLEDPSASGFKNYIRLLKKYPIGIATTGLHNSIGWKFAEYVAFSHAIVTEKLNYEAPGLIETTHYLTFDSADTCVEKANLLMKNHDLRKAMMENNFLYYQQYLKPDILIWRALSIALS